MIDQEVDAYEPLQRIVEKKEGMCVFRHLVSVPTVALVIMLTSRASNIPCGSTGGVIIQKTPLPKILLCSDQC